MSSPHTHTLHIAGWGAVSPAGWTSTALADAVLEGREFPATLDLRHPDAPPIACRRVPAPTAPPPWLRQPRLRRSSPITRFAVSAALEALHCDPAAPAQSSGISLGILFAVQNGSVNFSGRFFAEVLDNPSLASPILFPETVFNAPSSHLSSLLAAPLLNNTLVSDAGGFLTALDMAAQWLAEGRVTDCLIVSAEEYDWLSAEALALVPGQKIASEGAAALWLRQSDTTTSGQIRLEQITEAAAITHLQPRTTAIQHMRSELAAPDTATLISAASGSPAWDRPHTEAFTEWVGPRFTLQPQFGHPFSILGGWQSVLACELLQRDTCQDAVLPTDTGANQAQAAWFHRLP
jgi:hypothetical protein